MGVHYSAKLAATGGLPPYTWSISAGTLPAGLTLNAFTGVISGTPTNNSFGPFTAQVTDAENPPMTSAIAGMSITVTVAPLAVTTASGLPTATVGQPYAVRLDGAGGIRPYTWSLSGGALPAGLTLHPATGLISGTPTAAGVGQASFSVALTDSENPAVVAGADETLTVTPVLSVTTTSLPSGMVGSPYDQNISATGGFSPYSWSIVAGSLPPGLFLSPSGSIQGDCTQPGIYFFTVQVQDSSNPAEVATAALAIGVNAGPPPPP